LYFVNGSGVKNLSLAVAEFHKNLSSHSIFLRFFTCLPLSYRIANDGLTMICSSDSSESVTLIAEHVETWNPRHILAVRGLARIAGSSMAEVSLLVADAYQGQGLGTKLLRQLLEIGPKGIGLMGVKGYFLPENRVMQHIAKKLGFRVNYSPEMQLFEAEHQFPVPLQSEAIFSDFSFPRRG
jgi:acetyltransferase